MIKIKETLSKKIEAVYKELSSLEYDLGDIQSDCERIDDINTFLEDLYYMTPDEVAEKAQDLIDGAGRFV